MTKVEDLQAKINELDEKILVLTKEKDELCEQLSSAIESEKLQEDKQTESGLGDEQTESALKKATLDLWYTFWSEDDNTDAMKRLYKETDLERLYDWIGYDIKAALKKSKMKGLVNIKTIIKDLPEVQAKLDEYIRSAETRLDFGSALSQVKKGTELSAILDYSFSPDDILNLMELHKKNKFRKKIKELLEDCNFHFENSMLIEQRYEELEAYCKGDQV